MNGVSPNTNKESPKTPGGISKSLLTPCRRVGLSRKWKKGGCSPFVSPLSAQNATPEKTGGRDEKRRKKCEEKNLMEVKSITDEEQLDLQDSSACSPISMKNSNISNDLTSTPCRNNQIPRKKSKVLSLSLKSTQKDELVSDKQIQRNEIFNGDETLTNGMEDMTVAKKSNVELETTELLKVDAIRVTPEENISKPVRTSSKSRKLSLKKTFSNSECNAKPKQSESATENSKPNKNSPYNLTKECIVVIQNKILKTDPHISGSRVEKSSPESDTELDIPLSALKTESSETVTLNTLDDDDFLSKPVRKKFKLSTIKKQNTTNPIESNSSESSQEEIDKRIILVKKTYEKVIKPQKAKSTGSITQKDIDELKARVEMKKKLLLAKAMSIDTEELRGLVKKWQKGCQNALMELLDLMKKKLPEKQNMDYAEILETLKIPPELVGYDSENDCFVTPDDTNVLLSAFKL